MESIVNVSVLIMSSIHNLSRLSLRHDPYIDPSTSKSSLRPYYLQINWRDVTSTATAYMYAVMHLRLLHMTLIDWPSFVFTSAIKTDSLLSLSSG